MFRSLRFRLPALFLLGMLVAGTVATAIAVRLFQGYARAQSIRDLRREGSGLTQLYAEQVGQGAKAQEFAPKRLETATGDRIYYVGLPLFPGERSGLRQISRQLVPLAEVRRGKVVTFEFTPPHENRRYVAVAQPVELGDKILGALVVAAPKTALRNQWLRLTERLALAFLVGIVVAFALGWYLSRRITTPLAKLSRAADEVAAGNYQIEVPEVPGGGEVGHLADRFGEMATRLREAGELERNFLMTVSHELRTPLTAIRGHVAALSEGVVEDEEARAASLDVIMLEAERLERLVGDVLDLAKLETHRFTLLEEEVDMKRLVERAYAVFNEEARRRGIEYVQDVRSEPVLETDGDRVLQVISNLLANAFRWTPDGGRISLELSAPNGTVRVAVDDTGPGIGPQERERIFRPFWTRDGGGTGLGLAIANELATALGGRIELATAPGQGSRFELVLPARDA